MKNVVIAAGYATRLYPLTENFPKPLLQIGRRTILDRMLDDLDGIPDIDEHIIVTNHKFADIFGDWAMKRVGSECPEGTPERKPIQIIDDGTLKGNRGSLNYWGPSATCCWPSSFATSTMT